MNWLSKVSVNALKLLVLTALENTWGVSENILFLGEWCKLYERRQVWGVRNHETVPFHWDDRNKLAQDYDYLESLHHRLLDSLAASLNKLHGVNHSVRYWQILLDPWLLTYVSILFDRWEVLRVVFEKNSQVEVIFFENSSAENPPFSYSEFMTESFSDEWNQVLCQRIIEREYLDQCSVRMKNISTDDMLKKNVRPIDKTASGILGKLLLGVDRFLGRCFSNCDVVFLGSNFNMPALVRLNLGIKQIPRLFLSEFKLTDVLNNLVPLNADAFMRQRLKFDFKPQSAFECLIKNFIIQDIPLSIIEGYTVICQSVSHISIKTKAVVTASAHWNNVIAKFWFAEQVNQGVKLVVLEHGGSFPAPKELFDFDEDISDIKGTWFSPYHRKHIQVPPSKLVSRYKKYDLSLKKKTLGKYCSVIANEYSRWVNRCHFYPMGAQSLTSFDLIIQLYEHLDEKVRECFKVKPYPNQGLNTSKRYEDILGVNRILLEPKIDSVFSLSKVIVCTYPETTFSEAMASGVPTVMLYPEALYERHPVAEPLLGMLRDAKIIFHDFQMAAVHLNRIWDDPVCWWNSIEVMHARTAFGEQALSSNKHWQREWNKIIKEKFHTI